MTRRIPEGMVAHEAVAIFSAVVGWVGSRIGESIDRWDTRHADRWNVGEDE